MPELPEVETVARGLDRHVRGERISAVEVFRNDSIGYPDVSRFKRSLPGHSFEAAGRRGKYILAELSSDARLVVHLRMSGRLILKDRPVKGARLKELVEKAFLRVRIVFESGRELHFEDMRVFGRLWYVGPKERVEKIIPGLAALGVEPLSDLDGSYLARVFSGKSQPVKNALLDQRVIAGIGNIYADESLFLSGINPLLPAGKLKRQELDNLAGNIVEVLERSIELGGTTLRDYKSLAGANGNYQNTAFVYGREGESCTICGATIERVKLAGRSAHFCPRCQPVSAGIRAAHEAAAKALKQSGEPNKRRR
jgi:formamidopyrimidine-DNA glycosylase